MFDQVTFNRQSRQEEMMNFAEWLEDMFPPSTRPGPLLTYVDRLVKVVLYKEWFLIHII